MPEAVTISVDNDNKISIRYDAADNELVEVDDRSEVLTLTIKDKSKELKLRKTDADGNPLKGAVFTIYQFDKQQNKKYSKFKNLVSDENGIFYGEILPSGYYLIEEVTPPSGYAKPDYDVVMHINDDNAVDELYSVRYDSGTGIYEKCDDLLEIWVRKEEGSTTVNFPNRKISGKLVIRKTIDSIDPSKGYPTFMFKVTQTKDENGNAVTSGTEYIRCISFASSDIETSKEITLNDLPIGVYKVEELSALNYTAAGLTVDGDVRAIISGKTTASITLLSDATVTVSYRNELKDDDVPRNTAFADNKISYTAAQSRRE